MNRELPVIAGIVLLVFFWLIPILHGESNIFWREYLADSRIGIKITPGREVGNHDTNT
jgi:hypothetical protein